MNSYFEDFCKKDVRPIQSRLVKRDIFELQSSINYISDVLNLEKSIVGNSPIRPLTEEICDLHALYKTLFTNLKNTTAKENLLKKVCTDRNKFMEIDEIAFLRYDISECDVLITKFSKIPADITNLCTLFAETCNCILDCPKLSFSYEKFRKEYPVADEDIRSTVYKCYHDMREYMVGAVVALSGIIEKIMNIYDIIDQTEDYIGEVLNFQIQAREKSVKASKEVADAIHEIVSKYTGKEDGN